MAETTMSWDRVLQALGRWHESGDREAGRAALSFIEVELRLMVPSLVRRTWPDDLIDDALQRVLERLVRKPLPPDIDDPRKYLARTLRNRCIDLYEARRRRQERSLDDAPAGWEPPADVAESPAELALQRERAHQVQAAVARLDVADRVVLKLDHAPEWLTNEEMDWLSSRTDVGATELRDAIAAADDMHALTRIFDPGDDDLDDPEARRKRMERFRRRRARARDKLRELLQEVVR